MNNAPLRVILFVVAAWIAVPAPASAHAFLDHASPAVGSHVRGAPASVSVSFTEALEPAFSTLKVFDAHGRQVDRGDVSVGAADHNVLQVSLNPVEPGTYRVVWRVLSVDSHVTEGDFTFTVTP